MKGNL
jgi:transposase